MLKKRKFISRNLEEDRAKIALEKEKTRKDYDVMSSQLKEMLEDENLTKNFLRVTISFFISLLFTVLI